MNTTNDDLELILARITKGDHAALGDFFSRTFDRMWKLASRYLHGKYPKLESLVETGDVYSVFSELVLKRWSTLFLDKQMAKDSSNPKQCLGRLSRIMDQAMIEILRKHYGRNGNRPQHYPLDAGGSGEAFDPGTDTHNPEEMARLTEFQNAIAALPEKEWQVVQLRGYLGLEWEEVAKQLGRPIGTCRAQFIKARDKLIDDFGANPLME